MDPIEAYPPEDRREVMLRRALIGDRFDQYDEDPDFHLWVLRRTDEILREADAPRPRPRAMRVDRKPDAPAPEVETIEQACQWIGILHRRSVSDAVMHSELVERIHWLALPWWRRAGRRPPWLRR